MSHQQDVRPKLVSKAQSLAMRMQEQSNTFRHHLESDGKPASHVNDIFCRMKDSVPDYSDPSICPVVFGGE